MECTAGTDEEGRLIQRETYVDGNGYTFDPRDVFKGEGGGLGAGTGSSAREPEARGLRESEEGGRSKGRRVHQPQGMQQPALRSWVYSPHRLFIEL